jgi:hypothetical protein
MGLHPSSACYEFGRFFSLIATTFNLTTNFRLNNIEAESFSECALAFFAIETPMSPSGGRLNINLKIHPKLML